MDKDSQADTSNILLIHGHHMKSGWMFKDLMKYKDESFYKEHATFQFSTLYEKEEYEIVAVILSEVYLKSDDVLNTTRLGRSIPRRVQFLCTEYEEACSL